MDLFVFGEIVKTHGLKGRLKALTFLESHNILDGLDFAYLESKSGQKSRYAIKTLDPKGKFLFLEFAGIADVDAAQTLVGSKLLLPRDMLDDLPDGEYYWQDIIGLDVYTAEGRHLGLIESIFPTGSNDVYVCRGPHGELLIPATADAIDEINLATHKMIVKSLEGLQP
ncbi:MAG: 16S rRNA processing protein RimM [Deltaproteobacteria bacterium]|nr:16S rRNA processing protein RimM [Deltaproteobacteria bacterium]